MNEMRKLRSHHLERGAYLYIRQSSMRQVMENVESTKRQYDLRGRAIGLGWRDDQIIAIDSDQRKYGASASWSEGFQYLVSDGGTGRAGIVMGLEVSRLARNNPDWHRLLETCALADTLILDEDGVYDPANFNDRLLLGLKGTMSEAELHVIRARLRGGILNKVRRGEYHCPLPTGFVYDEVGNVVLDPDAQIRETITHFFDRFCRVGSATQTVKTFNREGLLFPSRQRNAKEAFLPLTASTVMLTLHNPRYAGSTLVDGATTAAPSIATSSANMIPRNSSPGFRNSSPRFRTPIPATSAGSSKSARCLRPMAKATKRHAPRHGVKARPYFRSASYADVATVTCRPATPFDAARSTPDVALAPIHRQQAMAEWETATRITAHQRPKISTCLHVDNVTIPYRLNSPDPTRDVRRLVWISALPCLSAAVLCCHLRWILNRLYQAHQRPLPKNLVSVQLPRKPPDSTHRDQLHNP